MFLDFLLAFLKNQSAVIILFAFVVLVFAFKKLFDTVKNNSKLETENDLLRQGKDDDVREASRIIETQKEQQQVASKPLAVGDALLGELRAWANHPEPERNDTSDR